MLLQLALAGIPVVLAITLHEAAHGYAALALGDDTARLAGRLSLNPLRHIDRVGTILLPGFLLIAQLLTIGQIAFMFGWAKPVPVGAWKFANPRRGMMVVAAAGPAMNFFLAWLGALTLHLARSAAARTLADLGEAFVTYFILANLVLGLFNLLPVPPLDGGRIVVGLLPEAARDALGQAGAGRDRHRADRRVPAAARAGGIRHRVRSGAQPADRDPAAGDCISCCGWPASGRWLRRRARMSRRALGGDASPADALLLRLDGFEGPLDLLLDLARGAEGGSGAHLDPQPGRAVSRLHRGRAAKSGWSWRPTGW